MISRRAVWLVALACGLGAAPLEAQFPPAIGGRPPQAADTTRLTPEVLRARQRALLESLSRSPGADTLELRQMDTLLTTPVRRAQPNVRLDLSNDSLVMKLSAELVGYQPTEYAAARASFDAATRDLTLQGDSTAKATVRYQQEQVTADSSIHYNREVVDARGMPTYTSGAGETDPVLSRHLLVDTREQVASAFGARTRYGGMGANWLVVGDLPRVGRDTVYAFRTRFTSDEQRVPYYYFGASHVKIVRGKIMVAMPVRLYFGDVPVMWLPFVAQSLTRGRASGLLTPRFSLNDVVRSSTGYERRISNVGFYWAMNQYMDATVAMDWFSNNYTALTTGLRFRVLRHFLGGTISARQFWRATGGREFSLNGQQSWEISERMNMNASIAYVSSTSFLRQNTFDPLEATQQIMSSGGVTRRFDWGSLNLLGSRTQSLSDDRVDLSLPRATLSLKPITLFAAPANRAAWYNNATWSGGGSFNRRSLDFPEQDTARVFAFHRADQKATDLSANHSVSVRALSLGQDFRFDEEILRGIPTDTLSFVPLDAAGSDTLDIREANMSWSTSLSYQQTLVGQTSITPNVTVSSTSLRSDTLELAQNFVSAPMRVSFGASLRSQLYGFFPGFGPFEAVRHRVSPGLSYNWSPEVEPTELQRRVFGARTLQPQSQMTLSFSQTFEAKRRATAADTAAPASRIPTGPLDPAPPTSTDSLLMPRVPLGSEPLGPGNPTRPAQGQTVTLLSLTTSSISYDFVEADSAGGFIHGFTTTSLRNEIGSDYLRDLSISIEHDLFRDSTHTPVPGGRIVRERTFSPRLSAVNLRFSLSSRSNILRWLGLGGPGGDTDELDPSSNPDPFADDRAVTDEATILPGRRSQTEVQNQRRPATQREWNAAVSYALTRPRTSSIFGFAETAQNIRLALTTNPTRNWRMSWRTSYDLDEGAFNDHMVTLTRDLYRWQANFDFMKTATGNWAFRFEVSLLDASDLRFDYDQRSVIDSSRIPR